MKLTEMLEIEHRVFETLMELLGLAVSQPGRYGPAEVKAMAECLCAVVERHAHAEEALFYPRLKDFGALGLLESLLIAGHEDIRKAALKTAGCKDSAPREELAADVCELLAALRNHIERERLELFPLVERVLDAETLESMGREAMAALRPVEASGPEGPASPPSALEKSLSPRSSGWFGRCLGLVKK